jgi:hypothetical protein
MKSLALLLHGGEHHVQTSFPPQIIKVDWRLFDERLTGDKCQWYWEKRVPMNKTLLWQSRPQWGVQTMWTHGVCGLIWVTQPNSGWRKIKQSQTSKKETSCQGICKWYFYLWNMIFPLWWFCLWDVTQVNEKFQMRIKVALEKYLHILG